MLAHAFVWKGRHSFFVLMLPWPKWTSYGLSRASSASELVSAGVGSAHERRSNKSSVVGWHLTD